MRRTAPSGLRRAFSLAVVAVLVLSTVAPVALAASPAPAALADPGATDPPGQFGPDDPEDDVIGWENGYWYNESVDVDQSDGLDDEETEAFVARSMARVEHIRGAEFDEEVPVEVISREEYRNNSSGGSADGNRTAFNHWNDQVWEGLFIVGESTESSAAIGQTTGSSVAGFYSPSDDEIKIITPNPDTPVIDNATLVHELVHALQDQRYDLTEPAYRSDTQDGDLGIDGVIEGEANYIEAKYSQRCGGEWSCVPRATSSDGGGGSNLNLGVYLTIYNPYSDGPAYVHDIVESEGWDGFSERFQDPPLSSEQVIHRIDEEPVPIGFNSTARDGWEIYPEQGVNGSDTVGEASIFSMFWYQAREYGADTVDPRSFLETTSRYDTYNYDAQPSAGWANDRLFPYHNGTGENAEYGYVWKTEWDTETDAGEFHDAYLRILDAHEMERTSEGYYEITEGSFADTFAVVRNGTTVTIVNGPDAAAVSDIRPSVDGAVDVTETPSATPTAAPDPGTATSEDAPDGSDAPAGTTEVAGTDGATTETGTAGFGFVVAVAAVVVAGLLARFRD